MPWALRPAVAGTVLRLDGTVAFQDTATTLVSVFTGSYKFVPNLAGIARIAFTHNAPDKTQSATGLSNLLLGGTYTPELTPGLRLPLFFGVVLPVGMGGGNPAPSRPYSAQVPGLNARSSMDNALFVVNYLVFTGGVGLAYSTHGLTVHAEATLLQLIRVKGDAYEKDTDRTNLTAGLHLGYAVAKPLTVSAELRYQRWLTTPGLVTADPTKRDQLTAGVGLRTRIDLVADKIIMRPGLAYFHPVDDPMAKGGYKVLMLDVPVSF